MGEFTIEVDFGSGYIDITDHCSNLSRERVAHNDLRPVVNTARFEVMDLTIANSFITTDADIPVRIKKSAVDWFHGRIRPNFGLNMTSAFQQLNIECVDNSVDLQETIDESFAWENYKVCDTVTTSTSILHQLLVKAGFTLGEMNLTTINTTIAWYVVERQEEKTFWDEISQLLYEYGYVLDMGYDGIFVMHNLHPTSLSTSALVDADTSHGRTTQRRRSSYEAVRVQWNPIETMEDILVFSDRTNNDSTNPCNIALAQDEYYPPGSDTDNIYSVYRFDDGEILHVDNAVLTWEKTGQVSLNTATYGFKRALIKFVGGSGGGVITRYEIRGNVTFRDKTKIKRSVVYRVANSERILELETRFIYDQSSGDLLASNLANYYHHTRFQYDFDVADNDFSIAVGQEFHLNSVAQSFETDIRVVQLSEDEWGNRHAICEGISAYSVIGAEVQDTIEAPAVILPRDDASQYLTHMEDQVGYTDTESGAVEIPTQVTIRECKGFFRAINVIWDRQHNLTNFDHYEVQVSDNGTTWYSLQFDGTDWKDTLDGKTTWYDECLLHQNLPLGGTVGDPTLYTLYYHVRRVTKASVAGDWSVMQSATVFGIDTVDILKDAITTVKIENDAITSPKIFAGAVTTAKLDALAVTTAKLDALAVTAEKIAAGAVIANKVAAGVINTLVNNVRQYVYISDTVGFGGTTGSDLFNPSVGDQSAYLDRDEVTFRRCTVAGENDTAQNGSTNTITLAATASGTDDYYNGMTIRIVSGTGANQTRTITDYVGSTKVATVGTAWTTIPDSTSEYKTSGTWATTIELGGTSKHLKLLEGVLEVDGTGISYIMGKLGIGFNNPGAKCAINGGLHVGGVWDPGDNNLVVDGILYFGDVNTRILEGTLNAVRIQTNYGYVDVGPQSADYSHFSTDRTKFYMNKPLYIDNIYHYSTSQPYLNRATVYYNTWDVWLREADDNANFKIYGNTRQMAFRTDGTTEYATGIGAYPFVWMYGGNAVGNRLMYLTTAGVLICKDRVEAKYFTALDNQIPTTCAIWSIGGRSTSSTSRTLYKDYNGNRRGHEYTSGSW